jgi:hypothetical protein
MKIYNVLIKKNPEGKISDLVFLKEGLSYPALFFGAFWFLFHKMWREFLALLLVNIALTLPHNILPEFDRLFLQFALAFIVAINANHWLLQHLRKSGYELIDLVVGANSDEARFNFVKSFSTDNRVQFDASIMEPKIHRKMQESGFKKLRRLF